MAGVKGRSGKPKDKPYAEALRMELAAAGDDLKRLRRIAAKHLELAEAGDLQAINALADRLDGKPAQESTVTINRSVDEMTDQEIATRIAELRGVGASGNDDQTPIDPSQLN